MTSGVGVNNFIERAFSSYVKTCLQHAKKDYSGKLRRDSAYVVPLDAVNFEININFLVRHHDILQTQNVPILSQIPEILHLTSKEQRLLYHKYCEDKTDKEIAQLLGTSRQAVSKMKSNVLVKLKSIMEK
ncbi:sigma-70 family RNA polymerase sigma factor [Paenibacillus massiliensis]|uniref:sigma-70 family RNA polymerase sigma factor n=1 Tax=Paenibacillus massiliensis TaxID=225917 RepID=UPI00037F433A|nr:sigma-70 family RNA polymerase sigma factor [Paenibacillus massiliensis]